MKKQKTIEYNRRDISSDPNHLYSHVVGALGGTMKESFMELIDNSVDADASDIRLIIDSPNKNQKSKLARFIIVDNGSGMDGKQLDKSFTFAAANYHSNGDIGKFGAGGTAAFFKLARKKTVLTKTKIGELLVQCHEVQPEDPLNVYRLDPTPDHWEMFIKYCDNSGTVVILEDILDLERTRPHDIRNDMLKAIGETYHNRLSSKMKISVETSSNNVKEIHSNTPVEPRDPLHWGSPAVLEKRRETLSRTDEHGNQHTIIVRMVYLDLEKLKGRSSGAGKKQGIYFSRENRIISHSASCALWPNRHSILNPLRVEIEYPAALDSVFGTSAFKNRVKLPQTLVDQLGCIKNFRVEMDKKIRDKSKMTPESTQKINENTDDFFKTILRESPSELPKAGGSGSKNNGGGGTPPGPGGTPPIKNKGRNGKPGSGGKKSRLLPEYEIVPFPAVARNIPFAYDINEGSMKVSINETSDFVSKYYINASKEEQTLIRLFVITHVLALYESYDDRRYEKLESFAYRTIELLGRFGNLFT